MEDWLLKMDPDFRYQLLSRMKQDCNYYLGNGKQSKDSLWGGNEGMQIAVMKILWHSFPEEDKPEWLSMEQIEEYAQKMGVDV